MRRQIGLLFDSPTASVQAREFLVSSGLFPAELYILRTLYDANMIRRSGGLVVHVTAADRPRFPGHTRADGVTLEVSDLVVERAVNPGEYLPRMLSMILREVPNACGVSN